MSHPVKRRFSTPQVLSIFVLSLVGVCPVLTVCGQTTMNLSGSWFNGSNWTNGTPNSATAATIMGVTANVNTVGAGSNFLFINNGGTVNVTGDGVTQDSATLSTGNPMYVGYVDNGEIDVTGGGFVSTNGLLVGVNTGFAGAVAINGGGGSHWLNAGNTTVGAYGFGVSTGNLSLTNGASYENTGPAGTAFIVGSGVSAGNVLVDHSTLSGSNLLSVGHGGTGSLNVQSNSTVSSLTGVLGYGSGNTSNSTNSVGTANITNSSWNNSGEFHVGWYAIGNLNADGALITDTDGHIGYASSSVGMANLNSSVWQNSGSLNVGESGHGEMLLQNGSQVINTVGLIGTREGSYGKVTVDHSNWLNSGQLTVAVGVSASPTVATTGVLEVINGGTVTSGSGVIASFAMTNGSVSVSGLNPDNTPSSWTVNGELTVGNRGTGQLTIDSHGIVESQTTFLGYFSGSQGILNLNGTTGVRGNLSTAQINNGTGAGPGGGQINFNGGVLRATQSQSNYIRNFNPGSIVIASNGAIFDTNGFDIGVGAQLQGVGGLTKTGLGSMDLTSANLYSGDTVVEEGKLAINGSVAGNATIKSGAILGGTGTIGGTLTIEAGGILAPGNSPGTISVASVLWDVGGILQFELGATSDFLDISGDLMKGVGIGNYTFDFVDAGIMENQAYDLVSFANTDFITNDFRFTGASIPGGNFSFSGNKLQFTVSSVPEPASALLLSLIGIIFTAHFRRRKLTTPTR